jgi:hypothetical protein
VAPLPVVAAAAGGEAAEPAGVLGAGDEAACVELELELQAAAPTTRTAPAAAIRHLEPTVTRRDIPVKRTIAPAASLR